MSSDGPDLWQRLGARFGAALLRAWAATLRPLERGRDLANAAFASGPVIVAFWHSRFLLLPFIYPSERTIGVLISPSRDGDVIASVIANLGRQVVRGSSRKGGKEALVEMEQRLRQGWDVGIAVDGPLGPAYECKMGPVALAARLALPIVPLVYTTSRGWALNTWDRFWVPAPFSRVLYQWGEPMLVAADADLNAANAALNGQMRQLVQESEAWAKRKAPWA